MKARADKLSDDRLPKSKRVLSLFGDIPDRLQFVAFELDELGVTRAGGRDTLTFGVRELSRDRAEDGPKQVRQLVHCCRR